MNRYLLSGVASDLEGGADIVVIRPPYITVENIIHQIMEYTDETYTQVRLFESSIYHESGGRITIVDSADENRLRGRKPDVILSSNDTTVTRAERFTGAEIIAY